MMRKGRKDILNTNKNKTFSLIFKNIFNLVESANDGNYDKWLKLNWLIFFNLKTSYFLVFFYKFQPQVRALIIGISFNIKKLS